MATKPTKKRIQFCYFRNSKSSEGYNRERSNDKYHTYRWTKESKAFRETHPLCAMCLKKGLYVASEVVDHIIPVAICDDFWDQNNWQALCFKCNADKGNKDKKIINGKK